MMKNKTVMQHAFSMVPSIAKPRSVFARNHGYKTTFDADYLIPFYVAQTVLPGDSINLKHSILIRLNSPVFKPFMDNMYFDWFYFFVPYRLLWDNFERFQGAQSNPDETISYVIPQCTAPNVAGGGIAIGSLHDYLGLPTGALSGGGGTTGITFNNLVPRAYQLIWNLWFRDQNLQNSATVDTGNGPDTYSNYTLRKRGKRFDYFTSALPFLQKGTAVSLSLGSSAPVLPLTSSTVPTFNENGGVTGLGLISGGIASTTPKSDTAFTTANGHLVWNTPGLYADLSTATASTINTLRQSITLQQFLENDARGGTRYTEIVRQRWGVTSPDARLQRPEILSLGSSQMQMNPVTNNTANEVIPSGFPWIGTLGGYSTGSAVGDGFVKSMTEHGLIIGLISVRADLTYSQGLPREWSYRTRYDLPNPEFMNLGEQAILNKEIFANVPDGSSSVQKDGVFGYQERYAEARYSNSLITGLFRPDATSNLAYWHLSEKFASLPTLGSTFIQSNAADPIDRGITVPSEPQFNMDVYFDEKWARVMPMFSVPGLTKL